MKKPIYNVLFPLAVISLGLAVSRCSPVASSMQKAEFRKQLDGTHSPRSIDPSDDASAASIHNDVQVGLEIGSQESTAAEEGVTTLSAADLATFKKSGEVQIDSKEDLLPEKSAIDLDVSKKELADMPKVRLYIERFADKDSKKKSLLVRLVDASDDKKTDLDMILSKIKAVRLKYSVKK